MILCNYHKKKILQCFATFLQPPPSFYPNPLNPYLQTLNPGPSSGLRFGECKFNLEKSCFLLEKKI